MYNIGLTFSKNLASCKTPIPFLLLVEEAELTISGVNAS